MRPGAWPQRHQLPGGFSPHFTVIVAVKLLVSISAVAALSLASAAYGEPRFRLTSGKGWAVCEAYVRYLNSRPATARPPLCDLELQNVPGMKEPDWKDLPIDQHLEWVYQMEQIMGRGRISPEPKAEFESWKAQREERVRKQHELPRLRLARLAVSDGDAVRTVIYYNVDQRYCQKQVDKFEKGELFNQELTNSNFFLLNEKATGVLGRAYWVERMHGDLWLYRGKPYYVYRALYSDPPRFFVIFDIKRIEPLHPTVASPTEPPYIGRPLCGIRFDGR